MYNFEKKAQTRICPPLFKSSPTKVIYDGSDARPVVETAGGPACCPALYFFQLEYFLLKVWVPNGGSILQLGADQCVVGSLSYLLIFCFDIALDEI